MKTLVYRAATEADLTFIYQLAEEDSVLTARDPVPSNHEVEAKKGLEAINSDPNHSLVIVEQNGEPVGSFQLSFIPGISRRGAWRGQIESVRVSAACRGQGIGSEMMSWALRQCEKRGCGLVQLTSDRQRDAAHRFYERLGFSPSHTGFKLKLG